MPHLEVTRPVANAHVGVGVPFEVRGQAWEVRTLESPNVDTVTVRVDGGPPVDAALTPVKDKKLALVAFTATVVVAGGDDPHTVTVTAINDIMQSVHVSRLVFAGPSFTPTPPAVVVDLRPSPFAKDSPELARIEAALQHNLLAMNALLGGGNEVVIGPHLLVTEDGQGRSLLRLGLWIEPSTFSAQPPAPPTFPLPRLFPTAIEPSFALAPPQDTPPPNVPAPAFAMSVPMTTLQKLLDAIAPQVRAAAADKDVTVDTLRVGASGGNGVTTTVRGHVPLGLGFEVGATEFLGLHSVPDADPPQQVPAVVGRDHSSSVGGVLLWLVSGWFPLLRIALVGAWGYVSLQAADTSEQVDGMVAPLLAGLPRRIPFRNNVLPFPGPDFPSLVLHWNTLGVTAAGISGTGATEIVSRDPANAAALVVGPRQLQGSQSEVAGGVQWRDTIELVDFAPDPDRLTWRVTGAGQDNGPLHPDQLDQGATGDVVFPVPIHPAPGTRIYSLTITGHETCATDPAKVIDVTNTVPVTIKILKDPILPPAPNFVATHIQQSDPLDPDLRTPSSSAPTSE